MNRFIALPAIVCLALTAAAPAFAEKPADAGQGKGRGSAADTGNNNGKGRGASDNDGGKNQGGNPNQARNSEVRFVPAERDRAEVRTYYRSEIERGDCPPGLAKKNNGCLPPGQAKKMWVVGQPLPPSVVYYPLPNALVVRLTHPPSGYQYVRVGSDILLLAIGTRMVIDALADLSSM
jgi:hypothetical protein